MSNAEPKRSKLVKIVIALLVLALVGGLIVWYNLFREVPIEGLTDGTPRGHFLYASIGVEGKRGTPYWLWVVLPKLFPEYLPGPGGWASLGLPYERGHDVPMGVSKAYVGFLRTGLSCAFCHVSQVRLTADQGQPDFYPGGPSHQFDVQGFQRFLWKAAADPRFNADVILHAISEITTLPLRERLLYRFAIIPGAKRAILEDRDNFAWASKRPNSGPGRVDPFNPMKFITFKIPDDDSIGNADIPAIWDQKSKVHGFLHWDGLSTNFFEVAISSAIGDGAIDQYLDADSLKKVEDYLMNLPPPKYPLPVDETLALAGSEIFRSNCADCHTPEGPLSGTLIPTDEIGTDPHRTDAFTEGEVKAWKALAERYQSKYGAEWDLNLQKLDGYVAPVLGGVWLLGPYLHNGSVPSLRAMLTPPEDRPKTFYRGYDVIDRENVGFISDVPQANGRKFFLYDTSLPGNGNGGHLYGTDLAEEEKTALIEYLKTL